MVTLAISKETKFGYGFLLVGAGVPYLIEKVFGLSIAIVVCVICVVARGILLVAGHRHEETLGGPSRPKTRTIVVFALAGVTLVVLLSLGFIRLAKRQPQTEEAKLSPRTPPNLPPDSGTAATPSVSASSGTPVIPKEPMIEGSEIKKAGAISRVHIRPTQKQPQVDMTLVAKGLQEPPGAPFADGDNSELFKEMTRLESMTVIQIRSYLADNIERLKWFDHTKWHYPTEQSFDDVTIGPNGEDDPESKKEYDKNMATMQHLREDVRPTKRYEDFPKEFPRFPALIQYLQEKFPDVPVPIECYPDSVRDKKLYEGVVSTCAD